MLHINDNYLKLQASYLFADIAHRISVFQQKHPECELIRMGIGDVTNPLPQACITAFLPQGGGRNGSSRYLPRLRPGTGL